MDRFGARHHNDPREEDRFGASPTMEDRIRSAWQGRISGCQMGKAVELLSMRDGRAALHDYLTAADSLPIRDYI